MSYSITNSGKYIDIETVSIKDISIFDIAHHLTNIPRYNGANDFDKSYSVAQHSINVALQAFRETGSSRVAMMGLLHDASEAYLGDIISGVKNHLPDYKKLEHKIEQLIYLKYRVNENTQVFSGGLIKRIDTAILLDEAKAVFPEYYEAFANQYPSTTPLGIDIDVKRSKKEVYNKFLDLYREYGDINEN